MECLVTTSVHCTAWRTWHGINCTAHHPAHAQALRAASHELAFEAHLSAASDALRPSARGDSASLDSRRAGGWRGDCEGAALRSAGAGAALPSMPSTVSVVSSSCATPRVVKHSLPLASFHHLVLLAVGHCSQTHLSSWLSGPATSRTRVLHKDVAMTASGCCHMKRCKVWTPGALFITAVCQVEHS